VKRRLRKKLHRKEFREFGIKIRIRFNDTNKTGSENLMNDFIDFIEKNSTYCGGGGDDKEWEMIIEINKKLHTPENLTEKIKGFFYEKLINGYEFESEIIDLWYP
jgi:uncharacterized protein YggL (DUF469 family)